MAKTEKTNSGSNRSAIVTAAIQGFLETGFHQTGVRDIAKRAGVSLGNLYNHFAGKDALVAEIAKMDAEEIDTRLSALPVDGTALEQLMALFLGEMRAAADGTNARLTAELAAEALRNPNVAEIFAQNEARLTTEIDRLAQEALTAKDITSTASLSFLLPAAQGMGFDCAFHKKGVTNELCHALEDLVKRALGA